MTRELWIAEVEARVDAWQRILEIKRKQGIAKKQGITITISREFGCEGFPLAERLKQSLIKMSGEEWVIFDRELVESAAFDLGISSKVVKNIEERGKLLDFFSSFFSKSFTKNQIFEKLSEHILNIAKTGNAIIIGRGGAFITRELANCFHFRLEGSLQFRVSSITQRLGIDQEAALYYVQENSKKREKFLRDYFGENYNDSRLFHAIFNNEKMSVELIAQCILKCLENKI